MQLSRGLWRYELPDVKEGALLWNVNGHLRACFDLDVETVDVDNLQSWLGLASFMVLRSDTCLDIQPPSLAWLTHCFRRQKQKLFKGFADFKKQCIYSMIVCC